MKTLSKNDKLSYRDVSGDLFDSIENYVNGGNSGYSIIVPHVCNNINLFGAGFAAAISEKYPIVKENFHLLGNKASLGQTQFITVYKDKKFGHELIFANMIAQNGVVAQNNKRPLNYAALCKCMISVASYIKQRNDNESKVQIHAPKFGSGLAGGNWLFIQELITDIWKDFSVVVYTNNTGPNPNKQKHKKP
jgi:hypothetical protein